MYSVISFIPGEVVPKSGVPTTTVMPHVQAMVKTPCFLKITPKTKLKHVQSTVC